MLKIESPAFLASTSRVSAAFIFSAASKEVTVKEAGVSINSKNLVFFIKADIQIWVFL